MGWLAFGGPVLGEAVLEGVVLEGVVLEGVVLEGVVFGRPALVDRWAMPGRGLRAPPGPLRGLAWGPVTGLVLGLTLGLVSGLGSLRRAGPLG